jgi:predicted dehydrogenase
VGDSVHVLDFFFIFLFGAIERVQNTSVRRAVSVDVDDVVSVNLKFRNGAVGTLTTMLATPRHWRIQAFGTSQCAHMRQEHSLDLCTGPADMEARSFEIVDTVRLELEAFADTMSGNSASTISADGQGSG